MTLTKPPAIPVNTATYRIRLGSLLLDWYRTDTHTTATGDRITRGFSYSSNGVLIL